jgi:prolyl 3-hydroxylase /prolyl 3,4-dihydroxylase
VRSIWQPTWYGAGNPAVVPTMTLLPHFNSMALFTVQPGRSFHAVQEVFTDTKPRLSISGWFHGTTPPRGADAASLNQLKGATPMELAAASVLDGFTWPSEESLTGFHALPHAAAVGGVDGDVGALTDDERALLARWINPVYLGRSAERKMVAQWETSSCVELRSFLRSDVVAPVSRLCMIVEIFPCSYG